MEPHDDGRVLGGTVVTLSAEDLGHAERLLRLLTEGTATLPTSEESLLRVARLSLLAREARAKHFSPAMFGEPAWDLLLNLYVEAADGVVPTVSSLAKAAGIPITTAMRWMDYLEERKLIKRERSDADRRAWAVEMPQCARDRIDLYLGEVLARVSRVRIEG